MIDPNTIIAQSHSNRAGLHRIELRHIPTGERVYGLSRVPLTLKAELMKELERAVMAQEGLKSAA